MKNYISLRKLMVICAALVTGLTFAGIIDPVDVTGWNQDVVIGVGEAYNTGSTAQLDDPAYGEGAKVFYGVGKDLDYPLTGLPTGRTQSETSSDLYFQLQPFGNAQGTVNNAVYGGGILILVDSAKYKRIALIGCTGQGTADLTIKLIYTDETDDTYSSLGDDSVNHDWFDGGSIAFDTTLGRISTQNGSFHDSTTDNPRLYETILEADETKDLMGVTIEDKAVGIQHNVIMAISGEVIPEPAAIGLAIIGGIVFFRRSFKI